VEPKESLWAIAPSRIFAVKPPKPASADPS
jgi:hypothetical protein